MATGLTDKFNTAKSKVGNLTNTALSNPRFQNAATSFKNKLSAFSPKKTLGGRFTRRKRSMDKNKKAWRRRTIKQRRR